MSFVLYDLGIITIVWTAMAATGMTLALLYGTVSFRQRNFVQGLMYLLLAACVLAMAALELGMMSARSVDQFAALQRWYQVPVWLGFLITVWFALRLFTERHVWLGYLAAALRTVSLGLNFLSPVSINNLQIPRLREVTFLGHSVMVPDGVTNPWMILAQASFFIMLIYLIDATWRTWRRNGKPETLLLGSAIIALLVAGLTHAVLACWGFVDMPVTGAFFFLGAAIIMGVALVDEVSRSNRLNGELKEQQKLVNAIFDSAHALITVWSREGRIIRWSKMAEEVSGFTADEIRERNITDWLKPEDHQRAMKAWDDVIRTGRIEEEFDMITKNGHAIPLLVRATLMMFQGRPHLMIIGIDTHDRNRIELELQRLQREMASLNRISTMGLFAVSITHEVNQPLTSILFNAECARRLLREPGGQIDKALACIEDVIQQNIRAGEIINRLRALMSKRTPQKVPVNLNELLQSVVHLVGREAKLRQTRIDVRRHDSSLTVPGDLIHLQQVFTNILMNAIDALDDTPPDQRQITIAATTPDPEHVRVEVADTGQGISPEILPSLFDPFITTKRDGMGFGLPISRLMVEAHHGTITAENNAQGGASFFVELPLSSK